MSEGDRGRGSCLTGFRPPPLRGLSDAGIQFVVRPAAVTKRQRGTKGRRPRSTTRRWHRTAHGWPGPVQRRFGLPLLLHRFAGQRIDQTLWLLGDDLDRWVRLAE